MYNVQQIAKLLTKVLAPYMAICLRIRYVTKILTPQSGFGLKLDLSSSAHKESQNSKLIHQKTKHFQQLNQRLILNLDQSLPN